MQSEINDNRPIRDIAYEELKHMIITGELAAGSRIVETEYAQRLHISRTPLREALRKLERDGLVEYLLRRGVVVRAFTLEDIEEIFTIRNAMMMLILPSVMEKCTPEDIRELNDILAEMDVAQDKADVKALARLNRAFHGKLERMSGRLRVLRIIDSQEEYITKFSEIAISSVVRRSSAHQEHHEMVRYLRAHDLDSLMRLNAHHLEESKMTCLRALETREKNK